MKKYKICGKCNKKHREWIKGTQCNNCRSLAKQHCYQNNKLKYLDRVKKYYEDNKEEKLNYAKKYRDKNQDGGISLRFPTFKVLHGTARAI